MHLVVDVLIVVSIFLLALCFPKARVPRLRWWPTLADWCDAHRVAFYIGLGSGVFLFQVFLVGLAGPPQPTTTDEFSYLLAADTFARGRLTNPTHPMWEHFESANIIHVPSYQSKYPPGQGLMLALGKAAFGRPIVGVWISMSLAYVAVAWMLFAWLPPRWAVFGCLLTVLNVPMMCIWGQTYWGGAVAMAGGALVFGALRRIVAEPKARDAFAMGAGLFVLAISRPYEGLVASLPVAVILMVFWLRKYRTPTEFRHFGRRVVCPLVVSLGIGGIFITTYNFRTTNDPFKMPYQVWLEQYHSIKTIHDNLFFFRFDPATSEMPPRAFVDDPPREAWYDWYGRMSNVPGKLFLFWTFFASVLLTPALLAALFALRSHWTQLALAAAILVTTAVVLQATHGYSHYLAPVACLLIFLLVHGFRSLRIWQRGKSAGGQFAFAGLTAMCVLAFAVNLIQFASKPALLANQIQWPQHRRDLQQRLAADGDKHLVIVRYPRDGDRYLACGEWVYNPADIDSADVIWARDLGSKKNQRLLQYYADRQIWILDPVDVKIARYQADTHSHLAGR